MVSLIYSIMHFVNYDMDSNLSSLYYKVTAFIISVLFVCLNCNITVLRTERIHLHMLRSVFSTLGTLLLFFSLPYINFADGAAILSVEPVLLTMVGVIYFKEEFRINKVVLVLISFIGVLFIQYPALASFNKNYFSNLVQGVQFRHCNKYYYLVVASLFSWLVTSVIVKKLSKTENKTNQLFYNLFFSVILMASFVYVQKNMFRESGTTAEVNYWIPDWEHLTLILICAVAYIVHCVCRFYAFYLAELSVIAPFGYMKIIFSTLLMWWLYDSTQLNMNSYIGFTLIITSGLLSVYYNCRNKR